ncbi:hypothetical protein A2U01_0044923, partial [Trifolium medium]|nr:hypothetical protein [Trifolium medium]
VLVLFQKSGGEFVQAAVTSVATTRSSEHDATLVVRVRMQEIILVMEPMWHQQYVEEM